MGSRYRQDLRTEFGSLLVDGRHTNIRPEKLGLLDTSALGLIVTRRRHAPALKSWLPWPLAPRETLSCLARCLNSIGSNAASSTTVTTSRIQRSSSQCGSRL